MSTALMKIKLPDAVAKVEPVKVDERAKTEDLTASKKNFEVIEQRVRDAAENLEKALTNSLPEMRRFTENMVRLMKLHKMTQAEMAAAHGKKQPWVSGLITWRDRKYVGFPSGLRAREAAGIARVNQAIKIAMTPAPTKPWKPEAQEAAPHEGVCRPQYISKADKLRKLGNAVERKVSEVLALLDDARELCDDDAGFEEFKRKYCPSLGKVGVATMKPKTGKAK